MSSRKMCVISVFVLTALWVLSLADVRARAQDAGNSSDVTITTSTNATSTNTSTNATSAAAPSASSGTAPASSSRAPRAAPGAVRRSYSVRVGPNGEVQEWEEGGGGSGGGQGGFGGGGGTIMIGGGSGGGSSWPAPAELRQLEDKLREANDDMRTYQNELRRYQGYFGAQIPQIPSAGRSVTRGRTQISDDPEARALNEKEQKILDDVKQIVEQYRASKDQDERANLKKKLAEATAQQFDIRQQYRELEVKRLEKELARIRESIQQRTDNREQIIKRRVAQLLHEEEDLEF